MVSINAGTLSLIGVINNDYIELIELILLIFFALEFILRINCLGYKSKILI